MDLETREFETKVELRESEDRSGPGTVTGLLIPYEQEARDRRERFQKGSARWDGTVPLNRMHDRKEVVARAELEAKDDGVHLSAKLPDTQRARDLATEIRAGIHRGLSVEMRVAKDRVAQGVRVILDAFIGGAGVVVSPAYATHVEARDKNAPILDYLGDGIY